MFRQKITEHIDLLLIEPCHAQEIFSVTDSNRKHLRQWLPWLDHARSAADTSEFIKLCLKQFAEGKGFQAGIWFDGRFCGMVGHHEIDRENRSTSLGYWLDASHQGRGIMTRCCEFIVNDAFTRLNLHRVVIRCAVENRRSRAIPERLGFKLEGIAREGQWLHDRFVDLAIYALLATERGKQA